MVICTSICANYLPKAKVLARSVKKNIKNAIFVVCLVEREVHPVAINSEEFDFIVTGKELGFTNFNRFIFKHSIVEASTSVKGQLFRYLYEKYPEETEFVYLDPDIKVYSEFAELKNLLKHRPIVLCPHLLEPGNIDMELSSTKHGVYNLGFLAVNRSEVAVNFINWWAERLYLFCYDDILNGIFTDQKWVDLAPSFFDVEIFKHRGYDFATWSLLNSNMGEENGVYYIKGDPLRFIHFSGYDSGTIDWAIDKWLTNEPNSPFRKLYEDYRKELKECGQAELGREPWSYACYYSKELVDKDVRYAYRRNYDIQFSIEDPFAYGNPWFNERLHLNAKNDKKQFKYIKRIWTILRNEGIKVLLRRIISKLNNS